MSGAQKIASCLRFVGGVYGRGEEAVALYTSIFPDSGVDGILRRGPNGAAADRALQGMRRLDVNARRSAR